MYHQEFEVYEQMLWKACGGVPSAAMQAQHRRLLLASTESYLMHSING
jgi:hypothetical protein